MAYFILIKDTNSILYILPYGWRISPHPVHLILAWVLHRKSLILKGFQMSLMMQLMRVNIFHKVTLHLIPKADKCPFSFLISFMTSLHNIINTFVSLTENLKTVQLIEIEHDDICMRDFSQYFQGHLKKWFRYL